MLIHGLVMSTEGRLFLQDYGVTRIYSSKPMLATYVSIEYFALQQCTAHLIRHC